MMDVKTVDREGSAKRCKNLVNIYVTIRFDIGSRNHYSRRCPNKLGIKRRIQDSYVMVQNDLSKMFLQDKK